MIGPMPARLARSAWHRLPARLTHPQLTPHLPSQQAVPPTAPGMITRYEWAWLHWWAANRYQGRGAVVDLGAWMGSTTVALGEGLAHNAAAGDEARVHAFDLFTWEPFMDAYAALGLEPGESFLGHFEANTAHLGNLVTVHAGDLATAGWTGGPIELLLNDASKTIGLSRAIHRDFVPHLEPGSWVMEQDFGHWLTGWVVIADHRLRHHLRWVTSIPGAGSVIFQVRRPIEPEVARSAVADLADDREAATAFRWARGLVHGHAVEELRIAEALWPHHRGDTVQARRQLADLDIPEPRKRSAIDLLDNDPTHAW